MFRGAAGGEESSVVGSRSSRRPRLLVAGESGHRRRASDVVRVVTAVLVLLVLSLVTRTRGDLESNFGSFVISLPAWMSGVFRVVYSSGTVLVGVGLVVLVVVTRRWRLMAAIVLTSFLATTVVFLLYAWLDPAAAVTPDLDALRSYPVRRLAVSVSVFFAVRAYVVRPVRQVFGTIVVITILGAVLSPAGLPLDVVAALVVGWAAAAVTALVLGSPAGLPAVDDVRAALNEVGVDATRIELADRQVWGDVRYEVVTPDGPVLDVVVFGRDASDAQLISKSWRAILYRDSGPLVTFSRQHRVEQIAYMLMLARQRGASVPDVVVAGVGGPSRMAAVVTRRPTGVVLSSVLDPSLVTAVAAPSDAALRALWRSLLALRSARIAHGALEPDRLVVEGDRAIITDFTTASSSAPQVRLDADLAEMLVSTAVVAGVDRAVAAMAAEVDDHSMRAVLPVLQPAALSSGTRQHVDNLKAVLGELRARITELTGADPPAPAELRRVTIANVVTLALTFVGVALILSMLAEVDWGELQEELQTASWGWIVLAATISLLPAFTDAMATLGGLGTQLPMAPLVVMNWAGKFIGIAMPSSAGQAAISIRFAQRQGIEPGAAISGGLVISIAGLLVQLMIIVTGLIIGVVELDLRLSFSGDRIGLWLVAIGAIALVVGFAIRGSLRLRRIFDEVVRPQLGEFRNGLRAIFEEPNRIMLLIVGNIGSQAIFGFMLTMVLLALGVERDVFLLALLANTGASLLSGLMPVPGGVGVWEGAAAAILVAGGIDPTTAMVAVLTHRILTFYLPPIYGWFAFAWLRRRDYL